MWELLRRFKRLRPDGRWLFLRAAVLLPVVALSLRLRGFRATQSSLQKRMPVSERAGERYLATGDRSDLMALTARMVQSAAYRGLGAASCLERSLTLWFLLGREGIASSIRIGTRKQADKFEAHAWVECDGVPVIEAAEVHQHYAAFDEAFRGLEQTKK